MDFLNYINEINSSITTLLNTLPFFHDKSSPISLFVGISVTLISVNGCPPYWVLGGVGIYENMMN